MVSRRRTVAIGATIVAIGSLVAGALAGVTRSSDETALQPTRQAADKGVERRVNDLLRKMTLDEKLQQLQLLSDGQITDEDARAGVGCGLQPHRSGQDQSLPADRGEGVAAPHPDPVRLRHDPRLPHDLPDPARRREQLRPVRGHAPRHHRRARDGDRRHQADLQPDGRRLARAALGPDRRGRRRGPVPGLGVRRRARQGRPGHRLLRARQGGDERQALRRVRPARGRARLQHHRHVRAAAAQPLPAAVQGRDRCGLRHGDVLVQRDQRRPRVRQPRSSRPTSSSASGASTASSRATTPPSPSSAPVRPGRRTRARAATASPPTDPTPPRPR